MGSAHTQPRSVDMSSSTLQSDLDRQRCASTCAPLSSSHPSRLQNQCADVPAQKASAAPPATVSASVPMSTAHPNAATFLRLAEMDRQLLFNRFRAQEQRKSLDAATSPCALVAPPATPILQCQPARAECKGKGHKSRQLRLSLFPCENCQRLCQPDVLSKDKKVYCSGECYFSAAFRGEQHNFHKLYNEVLCDDMELDADEQHQHNCCDSAEDGDEYLLACKRRARELQENEKVQPAARPSLVLATQPIRIPLPHPDYVPY